MPRRAICFFLVCTLMVLLQTACGLRPENAALSVNASAAVTTPASSSAAPAPSPAASPVPSLLPPAVPAAPETVAREFIEAQNSRNWDKFVMLWTKQEQNFYRDFFASAENARKPAGYFNILSANLAGMAEYHDIAEYYRDHTILNLPEGIINGIDIFLLDQYGDVRLFIAKAGYHLRGEFWDYREGVNYRMIVLVPEDGQWKVAQDYYGFSEAAAYFGDTMPRPSDGEDDGGEASGEKDSDARKDGTCHYTKTMTGYYTGINIDDYMHIGVMTIEREEVWFWFADPAYDEADLEKLPKNQKVEITWENRDKYIDDTGEVININVITKMTLLD